MFCEKCGKGMEFISSGVYTSTWKCPEGHVHVEDYLGYIPV